LKNLSENIRESRWFWIFRSATFIPVAACWHQARDWPRGRNHWKD